MGSLEKALKNLDKKANRVSVPVPKVTEAELIRSGRRSRWIWHRTQFFFSPSRLVSLAWSRFRPSRGSDYVPGFFCRDLSSNMAAANAPITVKEVMTRQLFRSRYATWRSNGAELETWWRSRKRTLWILFFFFLSLFHLRIYLSFILLMLSSRFCLWLRGRSSLSTRRSGN